jgi:outer membrane protein OmpA-like peptidoglycan-associated protein/flagellar hook assembly protein FlgD
MGGVSFDAVYIKGKEGKKDPFALNVSSDLSFPSLFYRVSGYFSMIWKLGIKMTIAEIFTISTSWPGGSGFNVRELSDAASPNNSWIPSVGLGVDIRLPSGGKQFAGGKLPSDGDLKISAALKPLYDDVYATGGGVTWYVGILDKKAPVIKIEYDEPAYFSPNHDGLADAIEFPISITDDNYVVSWAMTVSDEEGNVVRTIENKEQRPDKKGIKDFFSRLFSVKKQIDVPPTLVWDGFRDEGGIAPDGNYVFTISSADDSGNTGSTQAYKVVLKNAPPEIAIQQLSGAQLIFNPMGGDKPSITFTPSGSVEDSWESGIYNAAGEKIRSFDSYSGNPQPQVWNGRNDSGEVAPDGVYSFQINATDRAQNSASATLNNIILDGRVAGVFLTSSASFIAPKPSQSGNLVDFAVRLSLTEGVQSWKLELKDQSGAARRTFTGRAPVPASVGWNGLDDAGVIREGSFVPELTVTYTRGDEVKTTATAVIVDISGPELSLTATPEFFSPDNDGVDDELYISLSARDASPIASWSLQIRDPESGAEFYRIEGRGNPSSRLVWNGRSNKGELVQSATDYPYTFRAEDSLGNANSIDGKIGVDVLVIKDGDRLRIQIPSIVFRPNFADFEGLSTDVVDNNTRILRRIAGILNKFRDYKVQVEGHANPTTPPGPARDREEAELKTISENRAKKVVDELVRYGVTRSRLYYIGAGGTRTVVPYDDLDNRWKNRRVEFILIK